jgi:hypothetical protein
MGFFNSTCVDVEYFVCALAIASGTKEYARERAKAHGVGYHLVWAKPKTNATSVVPYKIFIVSFYRGTTMFLWHQ